MAGSTSLFFTVEILCKSKTYQLTHTNLILKLSKLLNPNYNVDMSLFTYLVPPVIKHSNSVVTAHIGQDAVLPCEVEGDSSPTVMWRKDGFPVSQDNNKYVVR